MLIGQNEISLNGATMNAAIQHYFDTVLFAEGKSPKVTSVKAVSGGGYESKFEVQVEDKKGGDVE